MLYGEEPMRPFVVSEYGAKLATTYPATSVLRECLGKLRLNEFDGFLRSSMTEGVPFAFQHSPMLYELSRGWLAMYLGVHAKTITMVGSGRIGFSLDPGTFGRPFGNHSDLDIAIVSDSLFSHSAHTFYQWKADIADGKVKAQNPTEQKYWNQNLEIIPGTLARGFIDENKLPTRDRYPIACKLRQSMFLLKEKLLLSKEGFLVTHASIRIYETWPHFLNQLRRNFETVFVNAPSASA
jgi:hypothetical protein